MDLVAERSLGRLGGVDCAVVVVSVGGVRVPLEAAVRMLLCVWRRGRGRDRGREQEREIERDMG